MSQRTRHAVVPYLQLLVGVQLGSDETRNTEEQKILILRSSDDEKNWGRIGEQNEDEQARELSMFPTQLLVDKRYGSYVLSCEPNRVCSLCS